MSNQTGGDPLAALLAATREFYQRIGLTDFAVEVAEISALYVRLANSADFVRAIGDFSQQSGKEHFGKLYKLMITAGTIKRDNERRAARRGIKPLLSDTSTPSRLGEFLICLFVPVDRQQDQLGDFEEKFNTLWLPKFGPRVARIIYIIHAARSAVTVFRIAAITAVVDHLMAALSR